MAEVNPIYAVSRLIFDQLFEQVLTPLLLFEQVMPIFQLFEQVMAPILLALSLSIATGLQGYLA